MDFPNSPVIGNRYALGTRIWSWNGEGWARVSNAGQSTAIFFEVGPLVVTAAPLPKTFGFGQWTLVNYV